jgi:hypothetical protein
MPARRFPPPWSVEEQSACFVVRDRNGQQLAYVYFEDEPGRLSGWRFLASTDAPRNMRMQKLLLILPVFDARHAIVESRSHRRRRSLW